MVKCNAWNINDKLLHILQEFIVLYMYTETNHELLTDFLSARADKIYMNNMYVVCEIEIRT